jgi:hypothetical protein
MITVEILPAAFGDSILIEYGKPGATRRILIDAGLKKTFSDVLEPRLRELGIPVALELLVVTHIDRDHICGIVPLLKSQPPLVTATDIWFNGRRHLEPDKLGVADGEVLGELLWKRRAQQGWNAAFGASGMQAVYVPDSNPLPTRTLPGGAVLTLLSPYKTALEKLASAWDDELGKWDVEPVDPTVPTPKDDILGKRPPLRSLDADIIDELLEVKLEEDKTKPNGSSIAFLFEYDGKRILFGADAHPSQLVRSLDRYSTDRVELDAFKLSHHGSMNNISKPLLDKIKCSRFLVSSDGSSYGHPNPETLAQIVAATTKSKTLCFNYSSDYTTVWNEDSTKSKHHYTVEYPADPARGYVLNL